MPEPTVTLREHLEALAAANDRRYTEVNIEKEKALKIKEAGDIEVKKTKEEADKTALGLAREIQTYKDEKHNGLLQQWQAERGTYVTTDKFEGAIKPLVEFMSSQQGKGQGNKDVMDIIKLAILIAGFFLGYFILK